MTPKSPEPQAVQEWRRACQRVREVETARAEIQRQLQEKFPGLPRNIDQNHPAWETVRAHDTLFVQLIGVEGDRNGKAQEAMLALFT